MDRILYRNVKTGTLIRVSVPISGENWILEENYKKQKKQQEPKAEVVEETQETEEVEVKKPTVDKGFTKAEIMQELEAFGIEYNKKANKAELLALLEGA